MRDVADFLIGLAAWVVVVLGALAAVVALGVVAFSVFVFLSSLFGPLVTIFLALFVFMAWYFRDDIADTGHTIIDRVYGTRAR